MKAEHLTNPAPFMPGCLYPGSSFTGKKSLPFLPPTFPPHQETHHDQTRAGTETTLTVSQTFICCPLVVLRSVAADSLYAPGKRAAFERLWCSFSLSVLQVKRPRPPGTSGPAPIVCLYGTLFLVWILGMFTWPVYLMETFGSSPGK